jgi:hypothetical protein
MDVVIQEDEVFGMEKFEWLDAGMTPKDTAYHGSKQILIYSENGLIAKLYSLDYKTCLLEVEKPMGSLIHRQYGSSIWSIISRMDRKLIVTHLINQGSESHVVYRSQITGLTNMELCIASPNGKWLLCSDQLLGGVSFQLFTIMGDITGNNGSVLRYSSQSDQFGATEIMFIDDDTICFGDHQEQAHILKISQGLQKTHSLSHQRLTKAANIWRQNHECSKYTKKPQLFSLPRISNLGLPDRGVSNIQVAGGYILTRANSMPSTLFIWKLDEYDHPSEVIITNTKLREILRPSKAVPLSVIISEDSISIWTPNMAPLSIPIHLSQGTVIRGSQIIKTTKSTLTFMVWTSDKEFFTIQTRLTSKSQFDNMDTQEISIMRRGSPMLTNDLTHVIELAAAVQQNEWGQTTGLNVEDTFQGRGDRLLK